jgi:type VI secretion system protein ImpB
MLGAARAGAPRLPWQRRSASRQRFGGLRPHRERAEPDRESQIESTRGKELSAMSKEGSVAPKERVNITYKPAIGNAKEEVELPLKMLMLGDYLMRPDPRPLEDRKPINIDKDNFQKVMSEQKLALTFAVKDKLSEAEDSELNVNLKFRRLSDMEPEAIANQVPELKKLLDLRAALTALKGPLGNEKAFRNKIQQILGDPAQRNKIINELGLKKEGD